VLVLLLSTGCALSDGGGFATIESAALTSSFVPGEARELGEGLFLTNTGARVRLELFELELGELELSTLEGSAGGVFDPANPPAGYGTCHSGHCHHEDGRLVSYEDIQAELAGGALSARTIVRFPVSRRVDLLRKERLELAEVEPSRELPETVLSRASLEIHAIHVAGSLEDGGAFEEELLVEGSVSVPLAETIDRQGKTMLAVEVKLALDAALFDDLTFADLSGLTEKLFDSKLEVSL
jgi:hypothetical protein